MPDPTLAIEAAISEDVREQILTRFPHQRGATVADLLDIASEHDHGLEHLEPAWAVWGGEVLRTVRLAHPATPAGLADRLVSLSMLTFVLADDLPLTQDRVLSLASDAALYLLGQVA